MALDDSLRLSSGAITPQQLANEELKRRGLIGALETGATIASSMVAEPVAGLAGLLAAGVGGGLDTSANAVRMTREALTYQPRTDEGRSNLQGTSELMQPIGDAFERVSRFTGDAAYNLTGSPAIAAAGYSVPTAVGEAIGMKGARSAAGAGRLGRQLEFGDIPAIPGASGQRGIFAGVRAKTADLEAQAAAAELAARGVSRDEIWQQTGWFQDVDGQWKFEIDDSAGVTFRGGGGVDDLADRLGGRAGDVFRHQRLFEAYPDLSDASVSSKPQGNAEGSYKSGDLLDPDSVERISIADRQFLKPKAAESTMLHELQHGIQTREGMASGGSSSPLAWADEGIRPEIAKEYDRLLADIAKPMPYEKYLELAWGGPDSDAAKAAYREYREMAGQNLSPEIHRDLQATAARNVYHRLAGEAEARNVQARMNMTPDERRATPPWQTLDVPEDELIVRMDSPKN